MSSQVELIERGGPAIVNTGNSRAAFLAGPSGEMLARHGWDPGVLRPWVGRDGHAYWERQVYNQRTGKHEPKVERAPAVVNASLPRDSWIEVSDTVRMALRDRLSAFADLRAAGLTYNLRNAMGHTVLNTQTVTDVTPATVSMDPIRRGESDKPNYAQDNLPIPIVHKDLDYSLREIEASGSGDLRLDTRAIASATYKVAEALDDMTTGNVEKPYNFGSNYIYGYTNFPSRTIKNDMTVPSGSNGPTVLNDFLALRQSLLDDNHTGDVMIYTNRQWSQYLENDFSTAKGDISLRQRLLQTEGFRGIKTLDRLPNTRFHVVMVEMTQDTVRAVVGMDVQVTQWESLGGFQKSFKIWCILVPQLFADTASASGIGHGTIN